jgi:hypothetical protein
MPREWRRAHGPDIIAAVSDDEFGRWFAAAFRVSSPSGLVSTPEEFNHVWSAQVEADALACKTFDHTCSSDCGDWRLVPG